MQRDKKEMVFGKSKTFDPVDGKESNDDDIHKR